ncbi:hypothetical protein, partial [Salmonella sp. s54395]|uniref:hypothetical protein n=1 Tax=Salmonella sp. s54395 TaxID=3159664 RepID=UPI00397F83FE
LREGFAVITDVMLAYRVEVPGSTTEIMLGNVEKKFKTTLLRVESIKHLKNLYGENCQSEFDALLAKQVSFFFVRRFFGSAWSVFRSAVSKDDIFSTVSIAFYSLLFSLKELCARIYRATK